MWVLVAQSCQTLSDPMNCSPPGLRLLCPWNSPGKNTGVGSHSILQGIFPTQGSNLGLPHCRQILYHLSHQGNPKPCGMAKRKKKIVAGEPPSSCELAWFHPCRQWACSWESSPAWPPSTYSGAELHTPGDSIPAHNIWGFPGGSDGKESVCNAGEPGSIPGSGRSPGEGNGNPLQYNFPV